MDIKNIAIGSAILVDVHEEPNKEFVLNAPTNKQSLASDKPCSHGTDDKYYVLKYRVFCSGHEQFHYANIGKFIEEYYLPKINSKRVPYAILEEISQKLTDKKLEVVTRDFDESGAVSVYATYLPKGFDSWDDYLRNQFQ